MNKVDYAQIEELIDHTDLLLDMAKAKLDDLKRGIKDPNFLRSAIKTEEMRLSKQIDEILRGQLRLKKMMK